MLNDALTANGNELMADVPQSIPVEIISTEEPWTSVTLKDGTTIKARVVIVGVRRVLDERGEPANNPDGSPAYGIQHSIIFSTMENRASSLN